MTWCTRQVLQCVKDDSNASSATSPPGFWNFSSLSIMSDFAPKCVGLTFNNAHFQPPTPTFDCQTFGKVAVGVREGAQGERLSKHKQSTLFVDDYSCCRFGCSVCGKHYSTSSNLARHRFSDFKILTQFHALWIFGSFWEKLTPGFSY